MSITNKIFGAAGLTLLAIGLQLPANAQTTTAANPNSETANTDQPDSLLAKDLLLSDATAEPLSVSIEADQLTYPVERATTELLAAEPFTTESVATEPSTTEPSTTESSTIESVATEFSTTEPPVELAQARRRTRNAVVGSDFIGIGADFGYAEDVSFAVISKLSLTDKIAVRPSVLVSDNVAVIVPITYEFNNYSTDVAGFRLLPYAGVGASYQESDGNNENLNLLLTAGADVPLSQQFTLNAQANFGVLNDSEFGVTVGVGYNFGRVFGR